MPEQEAHIDLTEILSAFSPVSLAEMDAVRLMNRIDTKYVTSEATLLRLLEDAAAAAYLAAHSAYTAAELVPTLETRFRRITLVNPEMTERMTIDSCLCFKNFRTGKEASLRDAVIIERKQDGRAASPMKGLLLRRRIHPLRVSKYCLAVTLTDPSVIPGRFKLKVRAIEKLINHQIPVL